MPMKFNYCMQLTFTVLEMKCSLLRIFVFRSKVAQFLDLVMLI